MFDKESRPIQTHDRSAPTRPVVQEQAPRDPELGWEAPNVYADRTASRYHPSAYVFDCPVCYNHVHEPAAIDCDGRESRAIVRCMHCEAIIEMQINWQPLIVIRQLDAVARCDGGELGDLLVE